MDYAQTLTHKHRHRYQLQGLLSEWQLNSPPALANVKRAIHHHVETDTLLRLTHWADLLRKKKAESLPHLNAPWAKKIAPLLEDFARENPLIWHPDIVIPPLVEALLAGHQAHQDNSQQGHGKPSLLQTLYDELQKPSTQRAVDNHQRRQRKALKTHVDQAKALYQHHPCLDVVHLMLTMNYDAPQQASSKPAPPRILHIPDDALLHVFEDEPHAPTKTQSSGASQVYPHHAKGWDRMKCHRDQMLEACRQSQHTSLVGLAGYHWRLALTLEYGPVIWLILLFDPLTRFKKIATEQTPQIIADQVGRFWQDEITQGHGLALTASLASIKNPDASNQLGRACRDDSSSMARLQRLLLTLEALSYTFEIRMAKVDQSDRPHARRLRSQGCGLGSAASVSKAALKNR